MNVLRVDTRTMATLRPRLSEILIDSVAHGASVGFLAPLSSADADAFWSRVERSVAQKRCIVLAAALDAVIVGTVQLDVDTMPNQPHRAEVHKLLVHSAARGKGIGEALMLAAEHAALGAGRWLLTLDTATDAAARLYQRLGWKQAGAIPDYAMNPDGSLTATTFYWKKLGREA